MKAFVHEGTKGLAGTSHREIEEVQPQAGEVKVKLKYAGLNHRDLFVLERHKESDPALVIGSDGAGVIEAVGEGVTNVKPGDEVVIDASLGWQKKSDAPPVGFEIIGLPGHGTFAEYITVPAQNVEPKPAHLTWEEAGVLPLAALTAYRALFTRAKVKAGDTVLLPGVGSGAVTYLLLFAKAIGARVIVTSRSEFKREQALKLGADLALDSNSDWEKELDREKVDIAVETVGAATFNKTLDQLRPGGTLVTFGASAGDEVTINIRNLFYKQYNLLGTTMGSHEEFKEMLELVNKYKIKPVIDQVFRLSETAEAMKRLEESEQFGKIGIEISR
ncbi:zinc-binding alcohol dehydrogenase/oxidoreductase [Bacillus pakistanensis]|uniref:Zinc-binding alcohol dehydrogenase/oxidoreductase n=1 Tax=Rossellomorea pakistanensis TaxID=992288 RepID=A0ABS2NHH9_9BACI|nr:zinc-binding dehydrogenase [Bacillus pakistanensis]MBM7587325.1 zinc-binding alcohol dehydrogenase/oxidoreductase [Bacillus pakistanensis]